MTTSFILKGISFSTMPSLLVLLLFKILQLIDYLDVTNLSKYPYLYLYSYYLLNVILLLCVSIALIACASYLFTV